MIDDYDDGLWPPAYSLPKKDVGGFPTTASGQVVLPIIRQTTPYVPYTPYVPKFEIGPAKGIMPLWLESKFEITGGPYRYKPPNRMGVKMAVEVNLSCDVDVPTKDFDVPSVIDLKVGLIKALMLLHEGKQLYVGCMGGIGRTGLFLAALAKVSYEYERYGWGRFLRWDHRVHDPVAYVRKHYYSHAVETKEQKDYIAALNVKDIVAWYKAHCRLTN